MQALEEAVEIIAAPREVAVDEDFRLARLRVDAQCRARRVRVSGAVGIRWIAVRWVPVPVTKSESVRIEPGAVKGRGVVRAHDDDAAGNDSHAADGAPLRARVARD